MRYRSFASGTCKRKIVIIEQTHIFSIGFIVIKIEKDGFIVKFISILFTYTIRLKCDLVISFVMLH